MTETSVLKASTFRVEDEPFTTEQIGDLSGSSVSAIIRVERETQELL